MDTSQKDGAALHGSSSCRPLEVPPRSHGYTHREGREHRTASAALVGPTALGTSATMGLLLSDSLAVKQSLGQSCRVVQGPSLDPDGWKRKRKENDTSLANEISLDEVREEIEMYGSQGRTIEEVREDIAKAYDEEDAMDEAIAAEELAEDYEAYAMMTEDFEAEKQAEEERRQHKAATSVQAATRGKNARGAMGRSAPPPSPRDGAAALLQNAAGGHYMEDPRESAAALLQNAAPGQYEYGEFGEEYMEDPRDVAAALIQNAAAGDYGDDSMDLAAALLQNAAEGEYGERAQRDAAAALLQNAAGGHYMEDPRESAAALIQNAAAGRYGEDAQDDAMAAAALIQNAAAGY